MDKRRKAGKLLLAVVVAFAGVTARPASAFAAQCTTDADCGSCAVCVAGACEGLGLVACTVDGDCATDEYCVVLADAPCKNHCASKTCWVVDCIGNCDPYTSPCASGQACVEPIKGCCGTCQPPANTCATSDDCGSCMACIGGECMGLGGVACTADLGCAADEYCIVVDGAECTNHCASNQCKLVKCLSLCDPYTTPCDVGQTCVQAIKGCCGTCQPDTPACQFDADCDACAVCVSGQCQGLGAAECTVDDDCATDEYCMVNPDSPCKNRCASKECHVVDCAGICDPYGTPCPTGQSCIEPIKGCCGACQPDATVCHADADCGACAVCVAGECKGLGASQCLADADCGPGLACAIDPVAACNNHCIPLADDIVPDTPPAGDVPVMAELPTEGADVPPAGELPAAGPENGADVAIALDVVGPGGETATADAAIGDAAGTDPSAPATGSSASCAASAAGTPGTGFLLLLFAAAYALVRRPIRVRNRRDA